VEEMSIFDFLPPKEVQRPRYMDGARVLSLFDGMACGMLAMQEAGVTVDRYVAYEIDKYAVQTSSHNFPMIEHRGDVFQADFTEFVGFDWLVGGSPCTYWSIAQKNNRETEASGMGWELFSQYVRALREAKPAFFIYENNKSMSKAIRESITQTFGFDAICINSALVSAQNRQRLYWVGKRNADGTYSKVEIEQPEDRGILLRDVLESGYAWRDKQGCIDANYFKGGNFTSPQKQSGQRLAVAEPVRVGALPRPNGELSTSQAFRIYSTDGKSVNLTAQGGGAGAKTGLYAVPICHTIPQEVTVRKYTCDIEKLKKVLREHKTASNKEIAETLNKPQTLVEHWFRKDNCFSVPDADIWFELKKLLNIDTIEFDNFVTVFETRDGVFEKGNRCYDVDGKMSTLMTGKTDNIIAPISFANPVEWDEDGKPTKAISAADGKTYTVYEVKDGQITIKGKTYPIKLPDGFYIIRKLTVRECMRLQTVPEWYEFPVSDSQAYKMLGNGWTVNVIAHLIMGVQK
jgi:DNA (cytosine-5)-methyltransferase 3A